ncbi:hypothetical protein K438DRAFT_1822981 [Mycena galopus ATCC 62051]|nr:hypothetical protein K438DRAFT_1822981 [Mycena galopus ATCC 62051]
MMSSVHAVKTHTLLAICMRSNSTHLYSPLLGTSTLHSCHVILCGHPCLVGLD